MGEQDQQTVTKTPTGMVNRTADATQEANSHVGGTFEVKGGGKRTVKKGGDTSITQGNKAQTVNGNTSNLTTGSDEKVSQNTIERVGSSRLYNSGNATAANRSIAPVAATQAQKGDDKSFLPSITAILGDMSESITNVTTSIDMSSFTPFQPTGDLSVDFMQLVVYYQQMLTQFTIKNTLKKVLLAIQSEIEKIKTQLEETYRLLEKIPDRLTKIKSLILKDPKAALQAPSDENKPGGKTLTEEQTLRAVIPNIQETINNAKNV